MDIGKLKRKPPVAFLLDVNHRYNVARGNTSAAAIAYHGFLSLFPLLLLAASALGFALAGHPALRADLLSRLSQSVPGFGTTIGDGLQAMIDGRAVSGVAGLVGLLWTATGIAESAGEALGGIFGGGSPEGTIKAKVRAIAMTLGLGALAAAGTVLAGMAAAIDDPIARVGALIVALATDLALFVLAYRWLAPRVAPSFRMLVPGAAAAAAGWNTLKLTGGWYAARTIARSSAVYGTFASAVALLVLLTLAAKLFLYGAAVNRVLADRAGRSITGEASRSEPAVHRPRARPAA